MDRSGHSRRIHALIVSYNSRDFLPRLASSLEATGLIASVVLVDNRSTDDSAGLARTLNWGCPAIVIESKVNLGFGAAVNRAAETLNGRGGQLLIVNPDVALSRETLLGLSEDLDREPHLAVVGARLTTSQGEPVSSARGFPTPSILARRKIFDVEAPDALIDVDWICGALMLWNAKAFSDVLGFSEEYFLYFEDVDICKKAWNGGWRAAIDGRFHAVHDQGHGLPTSSYLRAVSRRSRRTFAQKWYGPRGYLSAIVADVADLLATSYHRISGR